MNDTAVMEAFVGMNMLDVSLIMYEFLGETKRVVSKKLILFRIFNYAVLILVVGYIFINFFYVQAEYYVNNLQPFFSLLQAILKYILLTTQRAPIRHVLKNILKKFWNYECFDENVRTATNKIHKTVRRIEITMVCVGVIGVSCYLLKPVILSNAMLPLDGYTPESDIMFAIVASLQFYCVWLSLSVVAAYDFVYVACCTHVILQLRLLKQKIKDALDKYDEDPKPRLCYYIKHHQFLYSVFNHMRNIFSVMLLFHYLVTLISSCFVLLQLFLRNIDAISYVSQIVTIVFIVAQFALYTFPAEEVAFEFLDIPNTIYISKWYKNKVAIQKLVLYVMMKSQQQQYFTGAGLIDINVETFDSVIRKAVSFCAVFKNVLNN